MNVWLPLACAPLETWLATQSCALTGNRTYNPLVRSLTLNPLSYTSQSKASVFRKTVKSEIARLSLFLLRLRYKSISKRTKEKVFQP